MTDFDYASARATAVRLIGRFGQAATLKKPAEHSCRIAVLAYENFAIDETTIRATDKRVFMSTAGLAVEPAEMDVLTIGGVDHSIINVKPLSPAGTVVFWEAQCRK